MAHFFRNTTLSLASGSFLLSISSSVFAISNIESDRVAPPAEGVSGQVELAIDGKSGNSRKQSQKYSGRILYKRQDHSAFVLARHEYGKSFDQKNADSDFLHLRYLYQQNRSLTLETYAQYQRDEFKRLISRKLLGAGLRWEWLNSTSSSAATGLGLYYTEEKHDQALSPVILVDDYARASSYLVLKHQINSNSYVSNISYYQPRFSQPSDFYLLNSVSLTSGITNRLSIRANLQTEHDSIPPEGIKKTDNSYTVSFAYEF
jgi:putative salt-induced outer membrane protein YdiY